MNIRRIVRKAAGASRGFTLLALASCETSPDVVSFNTPELCELERTDIATFTEAREACEDDCQICVATTYADHALTYAIAPEGNCVCPAPVAAPDAGADPSRDASPAPTASDAGSALPAAPNVAADGCSSLLNQSLSGAAAYCDTHSDCNVCVERVDFDNEPRRYMAHLCGCPSPYRLE